MRMTPTEQARPNSDPRTHAERQARDVADNGHDKRKYDGIHPCLRALPDYPAR